MADLIIGNETYEGIEKVNIKDTNNNYVTFGEKYYEILDIGTSSGMIVLSNNSSDESVFNTLWDSYPVSEIQNYSNVCYAMDRYMYEIQLYNPEIAGNMEVEGETVSVYTMYDNIMYGSPIVGYDVVNLDGTPIDYETLNPDDLVNILGMAMGRTLTMQEIYDLGITDPVAQQEVYDSGVLHQITLNLQVQVSDE